MLKALGLSRLSLTYLRFKDVACRFKKLGILGTSLIGPFDSAPQVSKGAKRERVDLYMYDCTTVVFSTAANTL